MKAIHRTNHIPFSISLNKLRYCDLTLVLGGVLKYTDGTKEYILKEGDILFLPAGSLRGRKAGTAPADYVSFNFSPAFPVSLPPHIPKGIGSEIRLLLSLYDRIAAQPAYDHTEERIDCLIQSILLTLMDKEQAKKMHPLVYKITLYLHQHLAERITLSEIADHCFFSAGYCDSIFKQEMGCSIIEYLLRLRIEEAKLLLSQEQQSVSEIALAAGFSNANYFARIFKKRVGQSPSDYRKNFVN